MHTYISGWQIQYFTVQFNPRLNYLQRFDLIIGIFDLNIMLFNTSLWRIANRNAGCRLNAKAVQALLFCTEHNIEWISYLIHRDHANCGHLISCCSDSLHTAVLAFEIRHFTFQSSLKLDIRLQIRLYRRMGLGVDIRFDICPALLHTHTQITIIMN